MTQVQRNEAYFRTEVDKTELDRLVSGARLFDPHARDGLSRVGLRRGDKVIDVGCGPIGALLVLADLVGPEGTVVGLDMDAPSLQRARAILDQIGQAHVQLINANINEMLPTAVCPPGPFDAAFCRQLLNNQQDPAATLRRIAAIVRPGGHIVVHSPLFFDPLPQSEPALPALSVIMQWFGQVMRRKGAAPEVAGQYHALCQEVGLTEVSQRGFFVAGAAEAGILISYMSDAVGGIRPVLVQSGIASEREVDGVLRQLHEAATWGFQVFYAVMHVELIAQVP
jgi:ubiquinone/menaquinone biosynthesis C-methylase UbiE